MIITLFALLLILTLILIIAGKYIEAPGLQLAGYTFLFLLGIIILFGEVEYQTGELNTLTPTYSIGCISGYPSCGFACEQDCTTPQSQIINTLTNTTYTYTHFTNEIYAGVNLNHIIGFLLCIISGLGFAIVLMNLDKFKIREGGLSNG